MVQREDDDVARSETQVTFVST